MSWLTNPPKKKKKREKIATTTEPTKDLNGLFTRIVIT